MRVRTAFRERACARKLKLEFQEIAPSSTRAMKTVSDDSVTVMSAMLSVISAFQAGYSRKSRSKSEGIGIVRIISLRRLLRLYCALEKHLQDVGGKRSYLGGGQIEVDH